MINPALIQSQDLLRSMDELLSMKQAKTLFEFGILLPGTYFVDVITGDLSPKLMSLFVSLLFDVGESR